MFIIRTERSGTCRSKSEPALLTRRSNPTLLAPRLPAFTHTGLDRLAGASAPKLSEKLCVQRGLISQSSSSSCAIPENELRLLSTYTCAECVF